MPSPVRPEAFVSNFPRTVLERLCQHPEIGSRGSSLPMRISPYVEGVTSGGHRFELTCNALEAIIPSFFAIQFEADPSDDSSDLSYHPVGRYAPTLLKCCTISGSQVTLTAERVFF